jgi:hypothetical protein
MIAVAAVAGWLALLQAYPAGAMIGIAFGIPILVLALFEMRLDDG